MLRRLGLKTEEEIKNLPDCSNQEVMNGARLQAWLGLQVCVQKGLVRYISFRCFVFRNNKHHCQTVAYFQGCMTAYLNKKG